MEQEIKSAATRFDQGKIRMTILPLSRSLREVMKVGEFGARKYGDLNYTKGMSESRYLNAFFRHAVLAYFWGGQDYDFDPECEQCAAGNCATNEDPKKMLHSGLHHLAHAAWNILAWLEQVTSSAFKHLDDRSKQ